MQSTRTRLTIAICRNRRYHGLGFGGDLLVDALGRIALAADSLGIAVALLFAYDAYLTSLGLMSSCQPLEAMQH